MEADLSNPETYQNADQAAALARDYQNLKEKIAGLYDLGEEKTLAMEN